MNTKQYNNMIDWTVKHDSAVQTGDSLATARAIFNNMGVALPNGSMQEVYETIKTNAYMGWRACTMQEAQAAADRGVAAIGISEHRIVVLSANDEEEPVAHTASVMTLDENTSAFAVDGLQYYSYSCGYTGQGGCGEDDANPGKTAHFDSLVGTRMTKLPNSSFNGQCINYAFLRMREVEGMSSPGLSYSNPVNWINNADPYYYTTYKTNSYNILTSNYCAVFSNTSVGHIIYLEYVQKKLNGDIINVYFTEAN